MTTTQSTRDELRSILLGYRAELSQGLNELATGKSAEEFYGEKLEQLFASHLQAHITADRKRVALEKEEMAFRYAIQTLQDTSKEFALENLQRQLDKNLVQQEEV